MSEAIRFGFDVGRKFNADGSPRRFPGNTIISPLVPGSEIFRLARDERDACLAGPFGACLTGLPDESLHMTVIQGVTDWMRDREHWTSLLATTAPLSEVDDLFAGLWRRRPAFPRVMMRADHLRFQSEVAIALRPADAEDNLRIRQWQSAMSSLFGVHFPGFDQYEFHISLCYGLRMPEGAEQKALEAEKRRFDGECAARPVVFQVPRPVLAYFDNMFRFPTERIARD